MTIDLTDNAPRVSYTVSQGATQTSFTVPFEFFDAVDLKVVVDGTTKTITTHYTVSGGNGSTGTVTMSVTGATGGSTVIIFRDIAFKRTTDFPTSGAFPIATLNTELDRNIALFDDQQDRIDRSVRLNDNDDAASMVLPLKASRKGTVLGFNATTGAAEAGPTIANVNSLADITTNINTVAGISSNVTTVAGISSNVTTVAGISSAVSSVAGVASLITSDFVSDLNTLATSAIVEDLNILATTDIVSDLNQLATSDFVSDLSSVEGIKANVTSVGNNIANVNTVATQLTSDSPTFTNTVTASAYTTSGGGIFFIGNTSFRQTGLKNTSGELDIDASSNIKLTTNTGVINLFNDDTYFGRLNQDGNGELVISSGSSGGGGAPVTALTFSGANATFSGTINTTSTNKIQFGDSGTYIHQSADGVLDLVSDSEIEINATTIDMNGNLDVSGSATIGTDVTSASGNFVTSGSNIALKHSSGENFFTATKDGGSAMYHDALPVFNTVSTTGGAIGTTNANTFTLDSSNTFFEVGATNAGTLVLSAQTNNDATNVGDIRFANANNGDDDGLDADGKMIARIVSETVTSDSNAGDDSGGRLIFSTKPEAGSITEAMRIDSIQNVGLGVTPVALRTDQTGLQLGGNFSIMAETSKAADNSFNLSQNAHFDGAWKYISTDEASNYYQSAGQHNWRVASSGTAGNNVSWTTAMNIISTGQVGINMTADTAVQLAVSGAIGPTNGSESAPTHTFYSDADTGMWRPAANTLAFSTGGGERIRVFASGSVAIGSDTPGIGDTAGTELTISHASEAGITIRSGTSNHGNIYFSDATSGTAEYVGIIRYNHGSNYMMFQTNGSEAVRINNDGALLVGTTDISAYNNNAESTADNGLVYDTFAFSVARYNGTVSYLNRTGSSDGTILELRKNGAMLGTLGVEGGYLKVVGGNGSVGSGLLYTNEVLSPRDAGGSASNGVLSLGESGAKFKDAHFSGNVDCAEITYNKVNNSAGNSGLNVSAQYSYDDNNTNTIGSNFHNNHTFIYINTNAGFTVVPVLSNGGSGIAWANYLWDPDNQTWSAANDMTFTQSGTSGNTFRIQISAGQGTGTIERTSGSMAYQVYISRPAGGS